MSTYYPPGAFFFSVMLIGAGAGGSAPNADGSFQEVSGIQAELETETVTEGGENRFAYHLPRNVRYPNLVLKRGVVGKGSALADWMAATFDSGLAVPITPKDLLVSVLDQNRNPLLSWTFHAAYPIRWQLASLESMENKVLIETLELSYNYFDRMS
ncbi:MAG TPA: phage tail protein [Thermoanaerobaculia bacterium]|jgi:phage tail-like protein